IGVVLSGTASDGTEGLRAIKAENGIALAQEPASAKFAEMPRNAMDAGVVDAAVMSRILTVVRTTVDVDFTEYKRPTFERRLARRMALRRVDGERDYL